jgi:hypothetical protein
VFVEWSLPYISKSTSSAAQRAPKSGFHCSFTLPPVTGSVQSRPFSSSKVMVPSLAFTSFIGT